MPGDDEIRKSDHKRTGGELPDKQEEFEDTSWAKTADHGSNATEAERKNVSKTLPETATKEKK